MHYFRSVALCLVLTAVPGLAADMTTVLFDCASLEACDIASGTFRVMQGGGPRGGSAIVFDEPVKRGGSFELDLSGVAADFAEYDELHFDLLQEQGVTIVTTALWGYPDDRHTRRWYSLKRFQKVGEWDHVRYQLALDDDGSREFARLREQATLKPVREVGRQI